MTAFESPELVGLFTAYTASPTAIGAHFAVAAERATAGDPLIVATGTDLVLYPGDGRPPAVEGFRMSTRGFKELAGVSHLGPALATLARMRELDPGGAWRADAGALLDATRRARAAGSAGLWRDRIAVPAFAGREHAIAAMVDHACAVTVRFLERALRDERLLTADRLRREVLDGRPVPLNRVMIATFFLTGMDLAHRILAWFDDVDLPWERTMVIVAGRQGRPTAGVTVDTNSVAGVIAAASRGRLPDDHLLIAPHAPVFPMFDGDPAPVAALERDYRLMWSSLRATAELGAQMFDGYPPFRPPGRARVVAGPDGVSGMPDVAGPDDWHALTTRLRVVMEDPRQLLSGAVTDYASRQLVENANKPDAVVVPGLDGEPYPALP